MSIIHPISWFGNSTLSIFLFSLPCFIGFITIGYFWRTFHNFLLRKSPVIIDAQHFDKINFDFEQNFSVLLIYNFVNDCFNRFSCSIILYNSGLVDLYLSNLPSLNDHSVYCSLERNPLEKTVLVISPVDNLSVPVDTYQ